LLFRSGAFGERSSGSAAESHRQVDGLISPAQPVATRSAYSFKTRMSPGKTNRWKGRTEYQ